MHYHTLPLNILFLFCAVALPISAQTDCFTYDDDARTIVAGINESSLQDIAKEKALTIPSHVTTIRPHAFALIINRSGVFSDLVIEGGNPEFKADDGRNALADVNNALSKIEIKGNAMTLENIAKMLEGKGGTGKLERIDIYADAFPLDASITSPTINENTEEVRVVLPAARVDSSQAIGSASIYGRFELSKELATFCGSALFQDIDDGSNFLFYIPTKIDSVNGEKMVYIQRVKHILPGQGILIHKVKDTSTTVELLRLSDIPTTTQYDKDKALFNSNMLRGVTTPTEIGETETLRGVTYTNMILYEGNFYPTSGGMLGANRAYLQVPSAQVKNLSRLSMFIASPDDLDGLRPAAERAHCTDSWYTLGGLRLNGKQMRHGIYIHDGKKVTW